MTIVQPNLSVWNGGNSFYKKIVKIVNTQHWKILPAFLIYYLHLEETLETQSDNPRYFLQSEVEVGWQYCCTLLVLSQYSLEI